VSKARARLAHRLARHAARPGLNPELMEAATAKEWGLMPREWR